VLDPRLRFALADAIGSLTKVALIVQTAELLERAKSTTPEFQAKLLTSLDQQGSTSRAIRKRFGEEWQREAIAVAESSIADLIATVPNTPPDLAFFEGIEAAVACLHTKVKAVVEGMMKQIQPVTVAETKS